MDAVSATSTASAASTTSATTSTSTADDGKSFATLLADAKADLKKGETLTTVDGHQFARIKGGTRDDMCVNLSGNGRNGQAFDLIWRDGRQFHVYGGKGADHKVVEVGHKAADTTSGATTTAADGTTSSDTAATGTTATGTTDTSATTTTTDASSSTGTAS
jgi:hypothetical protein